MSPTKNPDTSAASNPKKMSPTTKPDTSAAMNLQNYVTNDTVFAMTHKHIPIQRRLVLFRTPGPD